jgi:type IV secretory pathway TraG/TraD family ATPase VirD4
VSSTARFVLAVRLSRHTRWRLVTRVLGLAQQDEYETAKDIADALGYRSGYSRSETLKEGEVASEGRSETAVPVFTARDIMEQAASAVIILFKNLKPARGKRMDWREYPILATRRSIPAPRVTNLPPLPDIQLPSVTTLSASSSSWERETRYPRFPIDPEDFN